MIFALLVVATTPVVPAAALQLGAALVVPAAYLDVAAPPVATAAHPEAGPPPVAPAAHPEAGAPRVAPAAPLEAGAPLVATAAHPEAGAPPVAPAAPLEAGAPLVVPAATPEPGAATAKGARTLSLDEAEALALGVDPGVRKASVEVERARLATLIANLERVHASVDASIEELYAGTSNVWFASAPEWKSGVLGLSDIQAKVTAPLWTAGGVEAGIARAEDLERASTFDLASARRSVVVAVARAYWSERRLALLEDAQKSSIDRLAESERVVLARVSAGLAAGLDKNRAAARRAELDVQTVALASDRRDARVRLAAVLGIDEPVVLTDPLPREDGTDGPAAAPGRAALTGTDADALVQRALDARPELKAASLRGAAADEDKRAAESRFWPRLDAGVLAEVGNNPELAGAGSRAVVAGAIPFLGTAGDLQAGLTLSMNIFDTWADTHAVEDAGHRRRLAEEDLRALRRDVETDVRLAHAKIASLREQRAALARADAIEADNLDILQRAYERGEIPLTELLDEQVRLADAERQIVDVDAQLAIARLELTFAVGDVPGTVHTAQTVGGAP